MLNSRKLICVTLGVSVAMVACQSGSLAAPPKPAQLDPVERVGPACKLTVGTYPSTVGPTIVTLYVTPRSAELSLRTSVKSDRDASGAGYTQITIGGQSSLGAFEHRVHQGFYTIDLLGNDPAFIRRFITGGLLRLGPAEIGSITSDIAPMFVQNSPKFGINLPNLEQAVRNLEACRNELADLNKRDFCSNLITLHAQSQNCEPSSWRLASRSEGSFYFVDERSVSQDRRISKFWLSIQYPLVKGGEINRRLFSVQVDCSTPNSITPLTSAAFNTDNKLVSSSGPGQPELLTSGSAGLAAALAVCQNHWLSEPVQPRSAAKAYAQANYENSSPSIVSKPYVYKH